MGPPVSFDLLAGASNNLNCSPISSQFSFKCIMAQTFTLAVTVIL